MNSLIQKFQNIVLSVQNHTPIKTQFDNIRNFINSHSISQSVIFTNDLEDTKPVFYNLGFRTISVYLIVFFLTDFKFYVGQSLDTSARLNQHRQTMFVDTHNIEEINQDLDTLVQARNYEKLHQYLYATYFFYIPLKYDLSLDN